MAFKDFARKAGLWLCKFLLLMSIVSSVAIYTGSYVTSESFLKTLIQETMLSQFTATSLDELHTGLMGECDRQRKEMVSFPLDFLQSKFDVNCTELKAKGVEGVKDVIKYGVAGSAFDSFYNKKACEGSCFNFITSLPQNIQSDPTKALGIVSREFNDYVKGKLHLSIAITLLLMLAVMLLAEGWHSKLTSVGGTFITSGLPYFTMPLLKDVLKANLPSESAYNLVLGLTSELSRIFLAMLIFGAVLWISGFILKRKSGKNKKK